jgi:hypothetical protein
MPALWLALDALAAAGLPDGTRFVAGQPKALLEHGVGSGRDALAA